MGVVTVASNNVTKGVATAADTSGSITSRYNNIHLSRQLINIMLPYCYCSLLLQVHTSYPGWSPHRRLEWSHAAPLPLADIATKSTASRLEILAKLLSSLCKLLTSTSLLLQTMGGRGTHSIHSLLSSAKTPAPPHCELSDLLIRMRTQ